VGDGCKNLIPLLSFILKGYKMIWICLGLCVVGVFVSALCLK